jgi:hypothetical protein
MGADLYIQQIHKPIMDKYQPLFHAAVRKRDALPKGSKAAAGAQEEVTKCYDLMYSEGYFRDSYNCTSVLWTLDLSWWRDVTPLCDEQRDRKGENLKKFREMVATANQWVPSRRQLKKQHATVDNEGENSLEEWHKYYKEEREKLLAFLNQAIELNTSIHCSL